MGLVSFCRMIEGALSAAALKCGVRDRWIGWDFRSQYDRLNLIANNSRFLILPEGRFANVGSRVLGLLAQRVAIDWQTTFGHPLPVVLALAAGATLCGMRGYQAMAEWAADLGQAARARFGCRRVRDDNGTIHYEVPSPFVIRDCLVRIDPDAVNAAFAAWQQAWGIQDEPLAIDGKTMKGAIDAEGRQTHMLSLVGHDSEHCYAQKKSAPCP